MILPIILAYTIQGIVEIVLSGMAYIKEPNYGNACVSFSVRYFINVHVHMYVFMSLCNH